jgi:hypothetical protein
MEMLKVDAGVDVVEFVFEIVVRSKWNLKKRKKDRERVREREGTSIICRNPLGMMLSLVLVALPVVTTS